MKLKKIHNKLEPLASRSGVVGLFLLSHAVLVLMMLFTFPRINAKFGTQAFDLKTFGYSLLEARVMLRELDQSTVDFYLFPQLFLLDILYPVLLALFLSTAIIGLSGLLKISRNHVFSNLFMLPFLAMFTDYIENILISVMLINRTNVPPGVIKTASIFTQMKGGFTTLSWLVVLILLVVWVVKKGKNKKHTANPVKK
ncbi:hypothetical protein ACT6NV_03080 [Robiginitalea sp. IMCC44478]|uniref:hypothetical protein n=1 Tax=Robiginitalea sp. IMCC44478 TaxID=3459122 RepID=UPI004042D500